MAWSTEYTSHLAIIQSSFMSLSGKQTNSLDALLNRPRLSAWQQFVKGPCVFLARKLYSWRPIIPAQPLTDSVSVVCISDTHNCQPSLPDGDVLIHAGDLTQSGTLKELKATVDWLRAQSHPTKIIVAGNHDLLLDSNFKSHVGLSNDGKIDWGDITYLQNEKITITCENGRTLRVYGSPYSPKHGNWAFQYPRSDNIWGNSIPHNVDILITHGPPCGHLDLLNLGCIHLLHELWLVRPLLHVFGHVHEGAGIEWLQFDQLQKAYEQTIIAGGGVLNMLWAAKQLLGTLFRTAIEAKCLLVNASIVGGLRDDKRRQPVRVVI